MRTIRKIRIHGVTASQENQNEIEEALTTMHASLYDILKEHEDRISALEKQPPKLSLFKRLFNRSKQT